MPREELSQELRRQIVTLYDEKGKSYREIAKQLGRSRSTIQSVVRNYRINKTVASKPRSGRPKALSIQDEIDIIKKTRRTNRKASAKDLAYEKSVSVESIRKVIRRGHGFQKNTSLKQKKSSFDQNQKNKINSITFIHQFYLTFI